jgi:opacity protein-like surface antigen
MECLAYLHLHFICHKGVKMKKRNLLLVAALMVVFGLAAHADDAAITGKWTAEVQGRSGPMTQTFTFKADAGQLTGTVGGGQNESPITDSNINGDEMSFSVTREFRGNSMKQNYTGKVMGDEIKFTVKTEGRDQTQEITAKRSK